MIEFIKIVLLCVLASVMYGIVHDMVTAHLCVEYFTVFHPPVFPTRSPILLALGWGVIATWWVGLGLGLPLAVCCRAGGLPKLSARMLFKPLAILLAMLAASAGCAGYIGYYHWASIVDTLPRRLVEQLPAGRYPNFFADWWAHQASYGFGFLLGIGLCAWVLFKRWLLSRAAAPVQIG